MQTERVTFLTSRNHKAALDAFAASSGRSVGQVVREATARYMAEPSEETEDEKALFDLAMDELEKAIPKWNAKLDSMERSLEAARRSIRKSLAEVEETK
jgi:hypothetical protein